jgi:hypothetical protein
LRRRDKVGKRHPPTSGADAEDAHGQDMVQEAVRHAGPSLRESVFAIVDAGSTSDNHDSMVRIFLEN